MYPTANAACTFAYRFRLLSVFWTSWAAASTCAGVGGAADPYIRMSGGRRWCPCLPYPGRPRCCGGRPGDHPELQDAAHHVEGAGWFCGVQVRTEREAGGAAYTGGVRGCPRRASFSG